MGFGLAYITTYGIVSVDNSFDMGTDFDHPLDRSIFFNYIDVQGSYHAGDDYEEIIRNKNLFYFAISCDITGNYYLDKRTNANAFVLFAERKISRTCPSSIKTEWDYFKFLKKQVKEVIDELNCYERGDVFNYSLYDFNGEIVDSYYGIFGKDFEDTIECIFASKIYKKFILTTNFDYISDRIQLNDSLVLKYLKDFYKTNDLDELIDVDFGTESEIFLKENILSEFYDFAEKSEQNIKLIFNNMVKFIYEKQLSLFSI